MAIISFSGGNSGEWQVTRIDACRGPALEAVPRISVTADTPGPADARWCLRGAVSNMRYATRAEIGELASVQQGLGRPSATLAAMIPLSKTPEWWALAQDERRAIFEETSHHTRIGMDYLPAVARRLHHGRDLGEPFDFVTWFEFAPEHEAAFDAMLVRLRATKEWEYVAREVDVRMVRA